MSIRASEDTNNSTSTYFFNTNGHVHYSNSSFPYITSQKINNYQHCSTNSAEYITPLSNPLGWSFQLFPPKHSKCIQIAGYWALLLWLSPDLNQHHLLHQILMSLQILIQSGSEPSSTSTSTKFYANITTTTSTGSYSKS